MQQVINVNHTVNAQTMAQLGKDVEQIVLSKALKLLREDRIFLAGNRTVIFYKKRSPDFSELPTYTSLYYDFNSTLLLA